MAAAQALYEGISLPEGQVGLITYMRTDSVAIAASAVAEAREVIAARYGASLVPASRTRIRTRSGARRRPTRRCDRRASPARPSRSRAS